MIHQQYFSNIPHVEFHKAYHEVNLACWINFEKGIYSLKDVREKRFQLLLDHMNITGLDGHQIERDYEDYLASKGNWLPQTEHHFFQLADQFNTSIITNGYSHVQGTRIKVSGIDKAVDHIFTSEDIGHSKPNLSYFAHVFDTMQIDPNQHSILVVGDSPSSDFQGALNAGVDFCWVNPSGHSLPKHMPEPNCEVENIEQLHTLMSGK